MSLLSWIFIGCLSLFLILFSLGLFSFLLSFGSIKALKKMKQRRPKNKQKRRRWQRSKVLLEKNRKAQVKRGFFFAALSGLFIAGGFYVRYYEMTNLSSSEGNVIVQTYFITNEVEKNLTSLQAGDKGEERQEKIRELCSLLASYGSSLPSDSLNETGQKLLTRYYVQMREYGTNLYSLSIEQLNDPEVITAYQEDLNRIKETQQKIFTLFSIDKQALQQRK